jgi:hypothetical protein
MRPPRALPQAKLGATNVIVFMFMTTKHCWPLCFGYKKIGIQSHHLSELLIDSRIVVFLACETERKLT